MHNEAIIRTGITWKKRSLQNAIKFSMALK